VDTKTQLQQEIDRHKELRQRRGEVDSRQAYLAWGRIIQSAEDVLKDGDEAAMAMWVDVLKVYI
jgi:hypothetical protein